MPPLRRRFLGLNERHRVVVIYKMIHSDLNRLGDWCLGPVAAYLRTTPVRLADFWTVWDEGDTNPKLACALDFYDDEGRVDWSRIDDHEQNIDIEHPEILSHPEWQFPHN